MSVTQHIIEALSSHPVGTFLTVAEIADAVTPESQRNYGPSTSAITARLFPGRTPVPIPGIAPGYQTEGDESSPRGARRID